MKQVMSYSDYIKNANTYAGILYLIVGTVSFIGSIMKNTFFVVLLLIVALASAVNTIKPIFFKTEQPDEMAQQHIDRAKALAMDYMELIFRIATIVGMILFFFIDLPVSLPTFLAVISFTFLGCNKLLVGILYKKYEEE